MRCIVHTRLAFNLEFTYKERKKPSLQVVDGSVEAGDFIVLCGRSGCGKSTLLRCINHLVPDFYEGRLKGCCIIDGRDISDLSIGEVGRRVSSVFQDPRSQFFTVNSSSEIAFGLENFGFSQEEMVRRVDESFGRFGLTHLKNRTVFELSSGERQLIAILCAWALDTEIILMDEPTANLDQSSIEKLREMLRELKAEGKTIIVSEHRLYYLKGLADEYWYMSDGAIINRFSPDEMSDLEDSELTRLGLRPPDISKIRLYRKGLENGAEKPEPAHTLSCEGVAFRYPGEREDTITKANLCIRTGEVLAITGPNGNGKTSLGKVICGILQARSGHICFDGRQQKAKDLQNKGIFVMQEAEFQFFTNSVWSELVYGKKVTESLKLEMEQMLKLSELWDARNRHPFTLSGGQMQKLVLLLAYFTEKPLAVLDEPTAGLDGRSLETCIRIIDKMKQKKMVLVITHDLSLIAGVCQACVWLEGGSTGDCFSLSCNQELQEFRRYRDSRLKTAKKMFSKERPRRNFDARIKLLIILYCCMTSVFADMPLVMGMFIAGMLINIYEGKYKSSIAYGCMYAALLCFYLLFPNIMTTLMVTLIPRFLVVGEFMTAAVSNDGGERTLAAFRFFRIPEMMIVIFAVMFRFAPVLNNDVTLMRQSIRTRGVFRKLTDKVRAFPEYMELFIAPMMLRVIRIAEALSASAETRGIALPGRRCSYTRLKVKAVDLLITTVVAVLIGFGFFM